MKLIGLQSEGTTSRHSAWFYASLNGVLTLSSLAVLGRWDALLRRVVCGQQRHRAIALATGRRRHSLTTALCRVTRDRSVIILVARSGGETLLAINIQFGSKALGCRHLESINQSIVSMNR